MRRVVTGVLPALALGLSSCASQVDETPDAVAMPETSALNLLVAPQADPDAPDDIDTLTIQLKLTGVEADPDTPLLDILLVSTNVDTMANLVTDLSAVDTAGSLTLTARTTSSDNGGDPTGGEKMEWYPDRETVGPIEISYTIPASTSIPPRGPAPPIGLSYDGQATSAAGQIILLLPPGEETYETEIDWDFSHAPARSRGVTSLGEGDVTAASPIGATELRRTYFMTGDVSTFPKDVPKSGFFAAWHGDPPFDADELMEWTNDLYGHYSDFFGQDEPPPYGVFLRYNPINAGGGVGLNNSFVTTFGKGAGADTDQLKSTLAHEMFHTFQPYIDEPGGLESSWFSEGLAVFYQARLPYRFGLLSAETFLEDLNYHAGRYYSSIMVNVPNSEVPGGFWRDTRIRTLPYDRGMLYMATVDHAVREASNGARSLDDLMRGMLALQQAGQTTTYESWETLLREALGEDAVSEFRAFLNGAMPVPTSDAFGVCFQRTTKELRRYEVGFEPAVLAEPKRIVRGLVEGSAAEAAGLRNGDEIVKPVPQDGIQGSQGQKIELLIRRGDEEFPLTYLPRGEAVMAYQWEFNPDERDNPDCQ